MILIGIIILALSWGILFLDGEQRDNYYTALSRVIGSIIIMGGAFYIGVFILDSIIYLVPIMLVAYLIYGLIFPDDENVDGYVKDFRNGFDSKDNYKKSQNSMSIENTKKINPKVAKKSHKKKPLSKIEKAAKKAVDKYLEKKYGK